MPPIRLHRARALHRTHAGTLVLLAIFATLATVGIVQFVVLTRRHDVPDVLAALSTGLGWLWAALAVLSLAAAVALVLAEARWLTGHTELTAKGVVLRSRGRAATVAWVDVEALRAVPARGGHLFFIRTATGTLPRGAGLGLQGGRREGWIGWHPDGDGPIAAIARPNLGIKYHASG